MFSQKRIYSDLSDDTCEFSPKCEKTRITWKISENLCYNIPLVRVYKYLGIHINQNLTFKHHLGFLKKKINYLTSAFTSIRKYSSSLRFCHNTWELFVRPLLDYSNTYINFCPLKDHEKLQCLYRNSIRDMLFIKNYVPIDFINLLIQYDYITLPSKFKSLAELLREEETKSLTRKFISKDQFQL